MSKKVPPNPPPRFDDVYSRYDVARLRAELDEARELLENARWAKQIWRAWCEDAKERAEKAEADAARLRALVERALPFVGYEACVDDLKVEMQAALAAAEEEADRG